MQEILGDTAGQLNLVAGPNLDPLEAFSIDFTELSYADGNRKAPMRCLEQVRERMASLGEKIIHHDQDSVYTSYRWLNAILLDDEMRISYSENGARGNPWIESLWGRTKAEVGSGMTEASSLPALRTVFDERFRYYNQDRRHSSIGQIPPREHLGQTLDTFETEPQIATAS